MLLRRNEEVPPGSLDHSEHSKRKKPGMTALPTMTGTHMEVVAWELWSKGTQNKEFGERRQTEVLGKFCVYLFSHELYDDSP